MPTSTENNEEVDNIYEDVIELYEKRPDRHQWICGGDFNGEVGNRVFGDSEALGPHGPNKQNNRGRMLVNFCVKYGLVVANTWTHQKNKTTWVHPKTGSKHAIDYFW